MRSPCSTRSSRAALRRRLTTVIDSLGLDADTAGDAGVTSADEAGMPCIAVVFDTPAAECRRRNAARPLSVPADVVANQFRRWPIDTRRVLAEPWDQVLTPEPVVVVPAALARRPAIRRLDRNGAVPRKRAGSASGCICRASIGRAGASSSPRICVPSPPMPRRRASITSG